MPIGDDMFGDGMFGGGEEEAGAGPVVITLTFGAMKSPTTVFGRMKQSAVEFDKMI